MPINSGDLAWVLASTALVMLMTPGVGFFYGGTRSEKEHRIDDRPVVRGVRPDQPHVGALRLQPGLRQRHRRRHRRPGLPGDERRGPGDLRQHDHTVADLRPVPDDVRHRDPGHPDLGVRRAGQALGLHRLRSPLGHAGIRARSPLDLGRRLAGIHWAPSTLPAVRSSTSRPGSPRSPSRWSSASG